MAVVRRLAAGQSHATIAAALGCKLCTVRYYIQMAARRVPGVGPPSARLIYWYRGATRELLAGER
jgi:hypothetical protein